MDGCTPSQGTERRVDSPSAAANGGPVGSLSAAVLLAGVLAVAVPYFDLRLRGSRLAYSHLPIAPIIALLLLLGLGRLGIWRLGRKYLFLIYGTLLGSASLASSGCADLLLSVVAGQRYFASPENRYAELFGRYVPPWWAPQREEAVRYFFERLPTGMTVPYHDWLKPLAAWGLFIAAFVVLNLSVCALLRRRWAEEEKLLFPLVQVSAEIVDSTLGVPPKQSLFRNRVLWVGFALPAVLHTVNALHFYFPAVPAVPLARPHAGAVFVDRPLTELNGLGFYLLFSVVGVSYLLSSEMALGLWFFYLFHLFERVILNWAGLHGGGDSPVSPSLVSRYQEVGAFVALAGYLFWTARAEFGGQRAASVRSRPALLGFGVGMVGMVSWLGVAGMTGWTAFLFVVLFLVIALTLTRLVAAGGVLFVECSFLPQDVLTMTFGSTLVGARSLTVLAFPEMIFMFEQQTILTPYLMDSLQVGHVGRVPRRQLLLGITLAVLVTVPVSLASVLTLAYRNGALALDPWYMRSAPNWPLRRLAGTLSDPTFGPNLPRLSIAFLGGLFFLGLMTLQRTFVWWPIHPLGFVMGSTFTLSVMWFSLLLGWALKAALLRWGSFRAYQRLKPAFLGLILGEYVTAFVWLLVDWLAHKPGHNIFPQF